MNSIAKLFSGPSLARSVLEVSPSAVVVASDSGTILFANQNVQNWFGYACSEITGLTLEGLLPSITQRDDDAHRALQMSHQALPIVAEGLQRVLCKDGSEVLADVTLVSIQEQAQPLIVANFSRTVPVSVDRQFLESERLDAIAKMISGLAHESRNALQRAVACLDLMELDFSDDQRQMELAAMIRRSLSELLANYDEVKRFSQPITLHRTRQRVLPLCLEAFTEVEEKRGTSENAISIVDHAGLDDLASVDANRLKEVFKHVIDNALDQRRSDVKVLVRVEPAQLWGRDAVRVMIYNDGEPFSDKALIRAFEPFYTTKHHGAGLGLSISRRLIKAHEGVIAVKNPSRGGALVDIILPRNLTNSRPLPTTDSTRLDELGRSST